MKAQVRFMILVNGNNQLEFRLQGNGNEQHRLYEMLTVDDRFAETFDLKLLAGRAFRQGYGNERENILVNESALREKGSP